MGPLLKVGLAACLSSAIVWVLEGEPLGSYWRALLAFALGALYFHFFEYGYHRIVMHAGVRFLGFIRRSHLEHHRVFDGPNFCSRREEDRAHIVTHWPVFPVLFFLHYAASTLIVPAGPRLWFFTGVTLSYLVFEATHWATHVQGNAFDRALGRIPLLSRLRTYQIEHHRRHHEIPEADFNFNPPYLGDLFFRTFRPPVRPRS
jgi:hypothetical protein